MNDEPKPLPQRKSPRLRDYDYSQSGAYFVTICTHQREYLFGDVVDGVMVLSEAGEIAAQRWDALPEHHPGIELDAFVVMPNHVHGVIVLTGATSTATGHVVGTTPALSENTPNTVGKSDRAGPVPTNAVPAPSLPTVVGSYKSGVTRRIRTLLGNPYLDVWQGRYHDHIIRNEPDLNRIREYVMANPALWEQDTFYDSGN